MNKKKFAITVAVIVACLAGCCVVDLGMPTEKARDMLTEETLHQIYPGVEIKFGCFFGEGQAVVVICEQQGEYFVELVEYDNLEPQRVWNLAHPPLSVTQLDSETLVVVGVETPVWTRERLATDFPEELLIKWESEKGFECSFDQHWASADQTHTYGEGNGKGIYAVLVGVSVDENGIVFFFGPGTEPQQKETFYAAVARPPRIKVCFDRAQGEIVLYDVKSSLGDDVSGLLLNEDMRVRQEGSDTVVTFTWSEAIEEYSLSTKYENGVDPMIVLQVK